MNDYLSKPVRESDPQKARAHYPSLHAGAASHAEQLPASAAAEAPPPPEPCPVDLERFQEITDGDVILLQELGALYLEESQELMEQLRLELEAGLVPEVEQTAHKLAGASATFGVTAIVEPLRQIEALARGGSLSGASALFAATVPQYQASQQFLAAYLAKL